VRLFSSALQEHGIDTFYDIQNLNELDSLESKIKKIPGQRSGLSFDYFLMLSGSDHFVKADRWICRFVAHALRRPEVPQPLAKMLIREAAYKLAEKHPKVTPRSLDHAIWKHMISKDAPLDRQAVFNKVSKHLRKQKRPAVGRNGECLYRAPDGLKCGIGALIKDKAFDPEYNAARIPQVAVMAMLKDSGVNPELDWEDLPPGGDDLDFLLRLQAAHDENADAADWLVAIETALAAVAEDFGLSDRSRPG
jgi:hypothetical protein